MADEQKYVVFKAEDWPFDQVLYYQLPDDTEGLITDLALEPDSYTVIRHQDVFAAPALFTYANVIQAAIELVSAPNDPKDLAPIADLEALRDLFQERALLALGADKKVPD